MIQFDQWTDQERRQDGVLPFTVSVPVDSAFSTLMEYVPASSRVALVMARKCVLPSTLTSKCVGSIGLSSLSHMAGRSGLETSHSRVMDLLSMILQSRSGEINSAGSSVQRNTNTADCIFNILYEH